MDYQVGGNFRLSEIAAALALVGIERFPAQAKEREAMADYMDEALSEIPGIRLLETGSASYHPVLLSLYLRHRPADIRHGT